VTHRLAGDGPGQLGKQGKSDAITTLRHSASPPGFVSRSGGHADAFSDPIPRWVGKDAIIAQVQKEGDCFLRAVFVAMTFAMLTRPASGSFQFPGGSVAAGSAIIQPPPSEL
jgi:hypothetical protein